MRNVLDKSGFIGLFRPVWLMAANMWVMAASQVAMCLSFSEKWTEITERLSDTNVHALAWRTSMAILDLLPERMVKHENGAV